MKLLLQITIFLTLVTLLAGCQEDYKRGYQAGHAEAKEKIYDEVYAEAQRAGYSDGFKKAYPGSTTVSTQPYAFVYKLLVWGGLAKILLSLVAVNIGVVFSGKSVEEFFGKALYSALGIGAAVFLITIIPAATETWDYLLIAPPQSIFWKIGIAFGSAVFGYFFLDAVFRFLSAHHSPTMLAWSAFLLSGCLTLLLPMSYGLFTKVPDISAYITSLVLSGMLVGGVYLVAHSLVRRRFNIDAAA